jgi:hypothetical protein
MDRTTKVAVALIVAAGLSTMVYALPEQRAMAWGGGFGNFGGCGGGSGCGGCGGFGGCGGCGGGICGFFGEARLTCSYTDNVHNAIWYTDCFG